MRNTLGRFAVAVALVASVGMGWAAELKAERGLKPGPAAAEPRGLQPLDARQGTTRFYRATWAVVIGIDQYPATSGLPRLVYAVNDARGVRDVLQQEFGYEEPRIRFLTDQEATRGAIQDLFEHGFPGDKPQADDAVLVFFAGHGHIDGQTDEGYLVASDSRVDDLRSCLSVIWLRNCLANAQVWPCRHKLLILDCCYSGSLFQERPAPADRPGASPADENVHGAASDAPLTRGNLPLAPGDNLDYYLRQPAFRGLSAGRYTPVADGTDQAQHSVFTASLLRVLRDQADSPRPDHVFCFRELAAQVETYVRTAHGSHQIPNSGQLGPGDGDFLFRPTVLRPTPRELSEQRKAVAHTRLVGVHVANAVRLMDSGDPMASLPWLAETLVLDREHPQREELHRVRLEATLQQCPRLVRNWFHPGGVEDVAFGPDGRVIASAGREGTARLWNVATGEPIGQPLAHDRPVLRVVFSPDGQRLATVAGDTTGRRGPGEARLWDVNTGAAVTPPLRHRERRDDDPRVQAAAQDKYPDYVIPHTGVILDASFSPDGRLLVTAGDEGTARIWDAGSGKPVGAPLQHDGKVQTAAFSPDGRRVLTASDDKTARLWDAATQQPTASLPHDGVVQMATFSQDGQLVATAGFEHVVRLWDAATGDARAQIECGALARHVAFRPDGESLVITTIQDTVRVWNVAENKWAEWAKTTGLQVPGVRHTTFSPDGRRLITSGSRSWVWDAGTGQPLTSPVYQAGDVARLAANGRLVVTARGELITVWDLATSGPVLLATASDEETKLLAVSPDRRVIATGINNPGYDPDHGEALLWDVLTGNALAVPLAQPQPIQAMCFSPDGRHLAVGLGRERAEPAQGQLAVWEVASGRQTVSLPAQPAVIQHVAWSPDGRWLATGGSDRAARVWEGATGKLVTPVLPHEFPIHQIAFSLDGKKLLVATGEKNQFNPDAKGTVQIWDPATGKQFGPSLAHKGRVVACSTNRAGSRLLTVSHVWLGGTSSQHEATLWDVTTGQVILGPAVCTYTASHRPQFNPEGTRLLLGSQVHDTQSGKAVATLPGEALAFADEGRAVVVQQYVPREGGDDEYELRICDPESGTPKLPALAQRGHLLGLAASPVGSYLAVVSERRQNFGIAPTEARVWDLATGDPVTPRTWLDNPHGTAGFRELHFSADGRQLLVLTRPFHGPLVWRWNLAPSVRTVEDLVRTAQFQSGRQIDSTGSAVPFDYHAQAEPPKTAPAEAKPDVMKAATDSDRFYRQDADAAQLAFNAYAVAWNLQRLNVDGVGGYHLLRRREQADVASDLVEAEPADREQPTPRDGADAEFWLLKAQGHAQKRQWREALAAYTKVLALDDTDVDAWLGRVVAQAELGDPDNARKALQRVHNAQDVGFYMQLKDDIQRQAELGNWAAVASLADPTVLTDIFTAFPGDQQYSWRALARLRLRQWDQSLADYTQAIQRDGQVAEYWSGCAAAHAALGHGQEARQDVERAGQLGQAPAEAWQPLIHATTAVIASDPKQASAWFLRGVAQHSLVRVETAVADLSQAVALDPQLVEGWWRLGRARLAQAQWQQAEACFAEVINLAQDFAGGSIGRTVARAAQGHWEAAADDFEGALSWEDTEGIWRLLDAPVHDALEREPQNVDLVVACGLVRYGLGDVDQAWEHLTAATQRADNDWGAWYFHGRVGVELERWEDAAASLSKALAKHPEYWRAWGQRGHVLLVQEKRSAAAEDLTKAIALHPDEFDLWRDLAVARQGLREWKSAAEAFSESLRRKPSAWGCWRERGCCHVELGQWDEAQSDFNEAVELGADDERLWEYRALLALRAGRQELYERLCTTALRRFGSDAEPAVAEGLARLCSAGPNAVSDPAQVVRLAEAAVAGEEQPAEGLVTLAAALYRAGRALDAVKQLQAVASKLGPGPLATRAWLFLALAEQQRGNRHEARQWLAKATPVLNQAPAAVEDASAWTWDRRLAIELLFREAEPLLASERKE